jgi:hypothetical protein
MYLTLNCIGEMGFLEMNEKTLPENSLKNVDINTQMNIGTY